MPKDNIDYSNTIIYKIYCKNDLVNDIYVGHTTNFTKRKYQHKIACDKLQIELKIYKIIRENGGWDNWNMVEIAKYNCKDASEARIKEQYHYEELKVSFNSCPPYVDKNKYFCIECNLQCVGPTQYNQHINCNLHNKLLTEESKNKKYDCINCHYFTSSVKDYNKHCLTQKHKKLINTNDLSQISPKNPPLYNCICGNVYKHMSSLCKHKKKCETKNKNTEYSHQKNELHEKESIDKDSLIIELLKQNKELLEIVKNGTNNHSHNTTNSHNKSFNLQFFLQETCKNAMNITDFVNNMKLELDDLENTGRTGYVEGISKIVIKNLNKLEQHMRPLHCSDQKREVLYIKDNNEWTKETEEKPILTKAIKIIANENIKQISKWKDNYPDCTKSDSKKNDLYLKIVSNSMNGLTKEESDNNITKIITNVAKNVIIEK